MIRHQIPIAFVIQRFGAEVAGGAEAHCRKIALKLAEAAPVEIWTTTALDYRTWKNHYPAGLETDGALRVRRFPVEGQREAGFDEHTARLLARPAPSEAEQLDWLRAQGPVSPQLLEHIRQNAASARALFFYTYLYWPTVQGLLAAPERAILIPTLHDEPVAHLPIFQKLLAAPRALLFLTPEEEAFARKAFPIEGIPSRLLGTAVEPPPELPPLEGMPRHYVLYLGRVDAGKGADELARLFERFLEEQGVRFPEVELIFCGQVLLEPRKHPRIRYLGFQSPEAVAALLRHATLVATPGPFESLSLTALEAMACGVPVLANGRSLVLAGHCERGGGGLYYTSAEEFEEALALLLSEAGLRKRIGRSGRDYVEKNYSWPAVLQVLDWALGQI